MKPPSYREVAETDRLQRLLAQQVRSYPPSMWSKSLLNLVSFAVRIELDQSSDGPIAPVLELVKR